MRHILATATAIVLTATTGQAALPPCANDRLLREAAYVVQITDIAVAVSLSRQQCQIDGTIIRSFDSPHAAGKRVRTFFPCLHERLFPDGPPIGGDILRSPESFVGAPVVELHIAEGGGIAGLGLGMLPLDAPTDAPALRPDPACDGVSFD